LCISALNFWGLAMSCVEAVMVFPTHIEISIFRVHNVKRVCGQIYTSRSVIKGQVVRVSVPISWWLLPIGYHFTLSTPPPLILMLWAASTNDTVELTATLACYVITN
jgi:hypothetical protein